MAKYIALTSLAYANPRGERLDCLEGAELSDADVCAEDLASFVQRGLLGGSGPGRPKGSKSQPPPPEA